VKQPSLTRAIQGLESEFGGPLFIRTKKGATLSHLGRLVRTHFLQIEDSAARAKATAKAQLGPRWVSEHMSIVGVEADIGERQEHQAATLVGRRNGLHCERQRRTALAYVYCEDEPGRRSAAKLVVVPNHVPPPNDCDGANGNQGGDVV
jgi:hypothetical protein